jgi:hypothetical protein
MKTKDAPGMDLESSYKAYISPSISRRDPTNAVQDECTCGGVGPDDKHTCTACMVYHRIIALNPNEKGQP